MNVMQASDKDGPLDDDEAEQIIPLFTLVSHVRRHDPSLPVKRHTCFVCPDQQGWAWSQSLAL
jgi:hypothetical protein